MEETYTLTFIEPVTFRMLRQACGWAKVDVDDLLNDPAGTLAGFTLPLTRAQGFMDTVLEDPPQLDDLPVRKAEGLAAVVCADFFSHICNGKWQRQAETLHFYMTALQAGHQRATAQA